MYHYIQPTGNGMQLIKLETLLPAGSEFEYEGQVHVCMHVELRDGTYGYLLPHGKSFNYENVMGQIRTVHPNPLTV